MKRGLRGQGTRGVRLRKDQEEKLAYLIDLNPELDVSTAIRVGLDRFIEEQMAKVGPRVFRSIASSLSGDDTVTSSAPPMGTHHKLARHPRKKSPGLAWPSQS